jgi:flagellar protein FliS
MASYREHALEGSSAVDLVVALYDGIIRFLYAAIDAAERDDEGGRRAAVKRALDIIIHLQARLRMDVGGRPAQVLSEFYASIFAQILQASQSASVAKFTHAIDCVRNVRDAWREVAKETNTSPASSRVITMPGRGPQSAADSTDAEDEAAVSGWTA